MPPAESSNNSNSSRPSSGDGDGEAAAVRVEDGKYTNFTKPQKRCIITLVAFAGMFSPLSSFIYYPAIHTIALDLGVTITLVNLTITSYMVVSGITPALVGGLAVSVGRRPIYLATFWVCFAANVGLAVQRSYPALLVLRMLQSAGGPVRPILGGALAEHPGWPWIFWLLAILSGLCLFILFIFFPETARSIVGSGGFPVTVPGLDICSSSGRRKHFPEKKADGGLETKKRLRLSNPLKCLVVLMRRDTALIVGINGICYATYCCVQASLALLFVEIYHFKEIQAGLIYLPFGCGCLIASLVSVDRVKGDDLSKFRIERARFRSSWYFLTSTVVSVTGYGWALAYKVNISVPLVLQFFIGASITCLFNMCGTLLTDLNPQNPALAQAASNIVRCALSAAGLAALQQMIEHMGPGWTFTVFAGLCLLIAPMILAEVCWGFAWRSGGAEDLELQGRPETTTS
ncbi:MAG: hypothetical protein LQ350_000755 [Teloschistes chrysophthalmus]|nr:MAG: hypothetical protein LQ350_000755 [Niorma chrysophthalma]